MRSIVKSYSYLTDKLRKKIAKYDKIKWKNPLISEKERLNRTDSHLTMKRSKTVDNIKVNPFIIFPDENIEKGHEVSKSESHEYSLAKKRRKNSKEDNVELFHECQKLLLESSHFLLNKEVCSNSPEFTDLLIRQVSINERLCSQIETMNENEIKEFEIGIRKSFQTIDSEINNDKNSNLINMKSQIDINEQNWQEESFPSEIEEIDFETKKYKNLIQKPKKVKFEKKQIISSKNRFLIEKSKKTLLLTSWDSGVYLKSKGSEEKNENSIFDEI